MTGAAPKTAHDVLDTYWAAVKVAVNLGLNSQIILFIDKHGNVGATPKVGMSSNGESKK